MASPLILSTWSFGPTANKPAQDILSRKNGSALDAVVAAATAVENDPNVNSVGVGGLPDAGGRVSLDACVMVNPDRCGAVYYLRNHANPAAIARQVMERTIHIALAGDGADDFAERCGFPSASSSPRGQGRVGEVGRQPPQRRPRQVPRVDPPDDIEERWGRHDDGSVRMTGGQHPEPNHDTVSILALDAAGSLAGACSTSGMAFKVPGRVGDSPIIGHGLYVDQTSPDASPDSPSAGGMPAALGRHAGTGAAAAATGNGELIMASRLIPRRRAHAPRAPSRRGDRRGSAPHHQEVPAQRRPSGRHDRDEQ